MAAVSNSLTSIYDKILARGLRKLRGTLVLPQLVNSSYSLEAAKKGQSVEVPRPVSYTATAVSPDATPPSGDNTTHTHLEIPLDQWFEVDFGLTDKEIAEVDRNRHFMPMGVEAAVDALAEKVNSTIFDQTIFFNSFANNTATTPPAVFGSSDTFAPVAEVNKILAQNKVPLRNRVAILDPTRYADLGVHPAFHRVNEAGTQETRREGEIGRNFGFDWFYDQQVKLWTPGNPTTPGTVSGAHALGATTLTLTGDTGTFNNGDVLTIAGDTTRYVVIAGGGSTSLTIEPPLASAKSGGEVVSDYAVVTQASTPQCIFMHRDAIAFAMRPLVESATLADAMGSQVRTMQDPQSGIILRLEVTRQHRQFKWAFDMLWGTRIIRPEMGVRLQVAA